LTTYQNVTIEPTNPKKNLEVKGLQGPLGKVRKADGNLGGGGMWRPHEHYL
jgi:hypothetical protein